MRKNPPRPVRRARRAGFTLIEVLVVLAILVLLATMVGPRILGSRKKANVDTAKTQVTMLEKCLESYNLDMKDFPTTEQGLKALVEEPGKEGEESTSTSWSGPYTEKGAIPKDPWGHEYQYEYPATRGNGDTPDIWSLGPDGEDNTDDDIVSWTEKKDDEA